MSPHRHPTAWILLGLLSLGLSACGGGGASSYHLPADYAGPAPSVNGLNVVQERWRTALNLRLMPRLSEGLDDHDLIIHFQRQPGTISTAASDWLEDWLNKGVRRQAVLVLRDGGVHEQLLQRWEQGLRDEAAALSKKDVQDQTTGEAIRRLQRQATETKAARGRMLQRYPDPAPVAPGETLPGPLFHRQGLSPGPLVPQQISTAADGPVLAPDATGQARHTRTAPATLRMRSGLVPTASTTPLIMADGEPLVMRYRLRRGELIVVLNATALTDAALVDPEARRLADAIARYVQDNRPQRGAIVSSLRVSDGQVQPPGILAGLLLTPPTSYVLWHLLGLALVVGLWRLAWLGRRNPPPGRDAHRFSLHLEAVGRLLDRDQAYNLAAEHIARYHKTTLSVDPSHPDEALWAVQQLFTADRSGSRRTVRRANGPRKPE